MKNHNLLLLTTIALFTLNSCGDDQKSKDKEERAMPMQNDTRMEHEDSPENLDNGKEVAKAEFNDEAIAAVYENYLNLKSALVNSDAAKAKTEGGDLVKALKQTEEMDSALQAAQSIASSEDINDQRTAFSDLSTAMETILEGKLASGEIFKQYCPMAFDGAGGYWLSSSEEVRNPYYGDKMLKCGRVEDALK